MNNLFFEDDLTPEERLYRALGRAEDRVSRLDERARRCGFTTGWRERADVRAALGALAAQGELVHPEDLALHALGADLRAPDRGMLRAHAVLRARQKAWRGGEELLSWRGVAWLSGRASAPPANTARPTLRVGGGASPGALSEIGAYFTKLERRASEDGRAATEEVLEVLDVAAGSPPLLCGAALIEAWRVADPLPDFKALGGVLAAQALRSSQRFTAALFPFEVALQRRPMPPRLAWAPLLDRLRFWCDSVERSAQLELDELDRLATQRALIERRAAGGRRNSKAPALAALALDRAVLTTELIARELGVTPQGAGDLLRRFDGVLREITGRSSYRVWRL